MTEYRDDPELTEEWPRLSINTTALEYWMDGNGMEYERITPGYAVHESRFPNGFVKQVAACGAEIRDASAVDDCLLVLDPWRVNNE